MIDLEALENHVASLRAQAAEALADHYRMIGAATAYEEMVALIAAERSESSEKPEGE